LSRATCWPGMTLQQDLLNLTRYFLVLRQRSEGQGRKLFALVFAISGPPAGGQDCASFRLMGEKQQMREL
jgi:hypothetical protein